MSMEDNGLLEEKSLDFGCSRTAAVAGPVRCRPVICNALSPLAGE